MRQFIKHLSALFLVPAFRFYLRKKRKYAYQNIAVMVLPGVFHPGFFHSTTFLLDYLSEQTIRAKSLLELGCGTGLISIFAARKGATVTAVDLSVKAIQNVTLNAGLCEVPVAVIHSDLFDNLPGLKFDWIIINPPYYARPVVKEEDLAWHAGPAFEYFHKLFSSLSAHIHDATEVVMVLTLGADLDTIKGIAARHGFELQLIRERKVFFDGKDFLFGIKKQIRSAP